MTTTYRQIFTVRQFRALFASHALTVAGATMQMLALSLLVFARTGSPLLAALAFLAGLLPNALGAAFLLSYADRLPPRMVLVGWDLIRVVVAAVLAADVLPIWAMFAAVIAVGTLSPVVEAARTALLADVLTEDAYVLGRSTFNVAVGVMQILGYAVGGAVLATVGVHGALWTTVGLFAASAVVNRFALASRPARASGRATVAMTWSGNRVLLSDPAIRTLLLALILPNGLIVGAEALFVPYAGQRAGVLFTAAAAGMFVGDIVVGRFLGPTTRARLVLPLLLLLALPYLAFAWGPSVAVGAALAGLASMGFGYHLGVQEQFLRAIPESMRGQAFGLAGSGMASMQGVAAAGSGALAEIVAPGVAMAACAAASLLCTLVLVRSVDRSAKVLR